MLAFLAGSKISVVSVRTPESGVVHLRLDLSEPFRVSTRGRDESTCKTVYSVDGLEEGPDIWHTIRIGLEGLQPVSIAALRYVLLEHQLNGRLTFDYTRRITQSSKASDTGEPRDSVTSKRRT